MSLRSRALRLLVGFCLLVIFGVIVMPARLWFGQREAIADAREQLTQLKQERTTIERRVHRLRSRDLIERQAHEDFGLVYEGDELYTLTPGPPPVVALPDVWPFDRLQDALAKAAASQ